MQIQGSLYLLRSFTKATQVFAVASNGNTETARSVQLSKPSDATYSRRPMGQPGHGRRPQPGQLTIGDELLGYHNNNNNNKQMDREMEN